MLLRRIAEDYVELASAAAREATPAGGSPSTRGARIEAAHRAAIGHYLALVEEDSNHSYPQRDEVAWYLAWEWAKLGDAANARGASYRLIAAYPDSPYASRAYFLCGALLAGAATTGSSNYGPAEKAFAMAAKASDRDLASVALRRLETAARMAGDTSVAADAARRLASRADSSDGSSDAVPVDPATGPMSLPSEMHPAGCAKDIECKGDRICENGRCVAPR